MLGKKRKLTLVTLTDSRTHGAYETIYPLLKELKAVFENLTVFVVDRADQANNEFFRKFTPSIVSARKVDDFFEFKTDSSWFKTTFDMNIGACDAIFMRIDRPFSDGDLQSLRSGFPKKLIINDPSGVIETGTKKFLLNFPDLCPDISLCETMQDTEKFLKQVKNAVFKPLLGYGGDGIVRISEYGISDGVEDVSSEVAFRRLEHRFSIGEEFLGMRYLKNVTKGDKRIVVAGSKVLGATLRLPKSGGYMCNLKQGGTAHEAEPDADELEIAKALIPEMAKRGVLIYGFDTLVDDNNKRVLSEINTLNVGGFLQAQEFSGQPVINQAAIEIGNYVLSNII